MPTHKVFVYGSCVSRDALALSESHHLELVAYVARQSLVSAFAPVRCTEDLPARLSPFQRRMVAGDIAGNFPDLLRSAAESTDVLVWDLADERLGFYTFPDGGCITRSLEILGTSFERSLSLKARLVEFGSDEHFSIWSRSLPQMLALLEEVGLRRRTLVLAVPWAENTSDGHAVPRSFGLTASQANNLYSRYYKTLEWWGLPVNRVGNAQADPRHRWGLAPFHYSAPTYEKLTHTIEDFCENAARNTPDKGTLPDQRLSFDPPQLVVRSTSESDHPTAVRAVPKHGSPPWLTYAFYVYARSERVHVRWYEPDPELRIPIHLADEATRVICFARDRLGRTVAASCALAGE